MTKANVVQIGLSLLLLAGFSYGAFVFFGIDPANVGMASQGLLLFLILAWVFTYFYRVVSGKMTFIEQRKRYIEEYRKITDRQLEEKLDSMSIDEKTSLLKQLEIDKNNNK